MSDFRSIVLDWYYKNLGALGKKQERYGILIAVFVFYSLLCSVVGIDTLVPSFLRHLPKEYYYLFGPTVLCFLISCWYGTCAAITKTHDNILKLIPEGFDLNLYSVDENPAHIDCFVQSLGWHKLEKFAHEKLGKTISIYSFIFISCLMWGLWLFLDGYVFPMFYHYEFTDGLLALVRPLDMIGVVMFLLFFSTSIYCWLKAPKITPFHNEKNK